MVEVGEIMSRYDEVKKHLDPGFHKQFDDVCTQLQMLEIRGDTRNPYEVIACLLEAGFRMPNFDVKMGKFYDRIGDMDSDDRISIMREEDGDMIANVTSGNGSATVQFCTVGQGGGKSPRTLQALMNLAKAIEEDNADDPHHAGPNWSKTE